MMTQSRAKAILMQSQKSKLAVGKELFIMKEPYGHLSAGYAITKYIPEVSEFDDLIQKNVEFGFYKFYVEMDYFLKQLHFQSLSVETDLNDQNQIIAMDHIWLYVYGFLICNCCNVGVFLLEILIFHRNKLKCEMPKRFVRKQRTEFKQ